jgi:nucleotide-binding universal stress UspA family protein
MEELLMLKDLLLKGDVPAALAVVEELEEMSRKDIIKTIRSYAVILLLHLIKQQAENRLTRSWEVSIRNCVREIQRENKRRKAGGNYLNSEELLETLEEAYLNAIDEASLEVEEGRYLPEELEQIVNREDLLDRAMALILPHE